LPARTPLGLDGVTLAFTIAVSVLSALLVGCVPALEASRAGVAEVLKDVARSAAGGARGVRFRSGLIVGEVALSVVLLIGSALLLVSLVHLQHTQPGFEPRGLPTAFINITGPRDATHSQQANFFAQLTARLEALPQVKSAAVGYDVPLTGFQASTTYTVDGQPVLPLAERARSWLDRVSEHYFTTMGIPLREGRMFNERDNDKAPNVCIINQSFAKRLFPGESPLGKRLVRGPAAQIKSETVALVAAAKNPNLPTP